ncbi:MAG: Hint domain-containing protein [Clostridium sp.]
MKRFCEDNKILTQQFHYHKKRIRERDQSTKPEAAFHQVKINNEVYGKNKVDNVQDFYNKGKIKAKENYCNAKTYVTKKASCFTADTVVKTEEGLKPISEVSVGEKVKSVNEDDVEEDLEYKKVTQVFETKTDTLINIVVDGEKIQTTKTHPWYIEGKYVNTIKKLKTPK